LPSTSPACAGSGAAGAPVHLAGRVVRVESEALWLADAFDMVRLQGTLPVDVGDLVVLSVRRTEGDPVVVDMVEWYRPPSQARREHARLIDDGIGSNLRARARALALVRSFFESRGFLEVDTPLLVPSPGLDLHLDAVEASGGYLVTSPEYQMKRLLSGGVPRLFQMSHVFRRNEVGTRHNPEFSMLEWYRAFATVEDVMRDTEELVSEIWQTVRGAVDAPRSTLTPPFPRMSVCEAFHRFASVSEADFFSMAEKDTGSFFRILVERVEPALAEHQVMFLVDYPISQASLARAKPDDPRVCERFELYLGGVELCNGFGELTDPNEQRRRLVSDQEARRSLGKPIYPLDERFLAALEEGMPPSAGNALGLDRLIALCRGEREIARVMPFPAGWI
jgi:lysyl-tRNA synthetase class 2